jgi:hypothetical protein
MLARSRTGRRAGAVEAYQQFCVSLEREGLAPSKSIVTLYQQILSEAPAVQPWDEQATLVGSSWTVPSTTFSVSLPPAFDQSANVDLAGRGAEMSELRAALDDTSAPGPTTIFLTGEPGIGKTRMASKLARTAPGVPFQPWRETLGHLDEHVPPHIARRHLDRFGPSLHLLMPSLAL